MDKYGVSEEAEDNVKKAADTTKCPSCGASVEIHGKVVTCPNCGTKPFEAKK